MDFKPQGWDVSAKLIWGEWFYKLNKVNFK